MFEDETLTGVIDLDLAAPGPRAWDAAYTAYRFAPLTDPANPDAPFRGVEEQMRRLSVFCSAYDDPGVAPLQVLAQAAAKLREARLRSSSARPPPGTPLRAEGERAATGWPAPHSAFPWASLHQTRPDTRRGCSDSSPDPVPMSR